MRCGNLIIHGFSSSVRNASPRLVFAESVSDHELGSAYQSSIGGDHISHIGHQSSQLILRANNQCFVEEYGCAVAVRFCTGSAKVFGM